MPSRPRRLAGALAVALVAVLAACQPPPPTLPGYPLSDPDDAQWVGPVPLSAYDPQVHTRTAIVADSLINGFDEQWVAGPLAHDGPLWMWSVSGSLLGAANPWLRPLAPRPDVLVIAQGTNNAGVYWSGDGWTSTDQQQFNSVVSAAAGIPCIVLVTLGYAPDANAQYKAAADNASLFFKLNAVSQPSRFRVADWAAASRGKASWFRPGDPVHFTQTGSTAYEQVITAAVRSCP